MQVLSKISVVQPPAAWLGGKRVLSRKLVEIISNIPHDAYAEPFLGMGGVFFRRRLAPSAEFINDRNGDVMNLFRILQRHYPQFVDVLKFQLTSRQEFDRLKECKPEYLTDLERAARFVYLQRLAYGGKILNQTFGVSATQSARFNTFRLMPNFEKIHKRLAGVVLENLDWRSFIDRYDKPRTLFYIDPPYLGHEKDYGKMLFCKEDFEEMAHRLKSLRGIFLLSINNSERSRELFRDFKIGDYSVRYTVCGGVGVNNSELIVSNI